MKRLKYILLSVVAMLVCSTASAQYYSWGADPESMTWRRIKGDKISVIYPDTAQVLGHKLFHYVQAVQPTIDFGFRHGAMKIPFVVHPENAMSNGMVMWLPKRVEILSSPAISSYSMPWLKQLAAHEYRHAVQYNNINRGFVKAFSYILGQQSSTIGLLFMPLWGMEGDAVISETSMSSFGRGLQPSFSMHYRAVGDKILSHRSRDKWFCGSFREYVPDHYQLGYQITSYANTKYDENIWDNIVRYAVRNPYVIATTYVGLKRFYSTSTTKLFRETFTDLNNYWRPLAQEEDSSTRLPVPKQRSYTTYRYPMPFGEGKVLSFKEDLDKPMALVVTDTESGREQRLCYTGNISTRPTISGGKIWWTEYRRGVVYQQRVNSRLCYVEQGRRATRTVFRYRNVQFPTAIDGSTSLAWVEYRPDGIYQIVLGDRRSRRVVAKMAEGVELHSLAYDNQTRKLYFIATDDSGMWLGRVNDDNTTSPLTSGAYITISDLRARDGVLYFGSIASGKDEVHCYNIASGEEFRISTSKYGSFSPMPTGEGEVLMTTYDSEGYHLASQRIDSASLISVSPSQLPQNRVNPPRKRWNTINLDTVKFDQQVADRQKKELKPRRYSKFAHLFNVHSWAPASYDPFTLSEGQIDFNLGVTAMSQSLLSNAEGMATWGWNRDEGSVYKGTLRYYGLGVNLSLSATYGGRQRMYQAYTWVMNPKTEKYELVLPDKPHLDKYYDVTASASLPLYFQLGYRTHYLGVSTSWNYSNGLVAKVRGMANMILSGQISNVAKIGYREGVHLLQFGIGYQSMVQLAHKDFLPRQGYVVSFNYALNPANQDFGQLVAAYAKVYLPGVAAHHSLSIAGAYQTTFGGFESDVLASNLSFKSSLLIPHGFNSGDIMNRNYLATSLNYQLPLCYPEGGIPTFLYFKRIRLNVGFDYASFDKQSFVAEKEPEPGDIADIVERRKHLFAYGGDLTFDVNFFRMPSAATVALTVSVYKPHGKKGMFVSGGVGLPF
ncbi:MAG: hypothetical protein J6Q20_00925 [Alistipes sp.]|nr:hypothetical protein [Alistipes sp.]